MPAASVGAVVSVAAASTGVSTIGYDGGYGAPYGGCGPYAYDDDIDGTCVSSAYGY